MLSIISRVFDLHFIEEILRQRIQSKKSQPLRRPLFFEIRDHFVNCQITKNLDKVFIRYWCNQFRILLNIEMTSAAAGLTDIYIRGFDPIIQNIFMSLSLIYSHTVSE